MLINDYYDKWRVRFESARTLPLVVEAGWFMFTLDLRAGYHHVRLSEGLSRKCGGKVKLSAKQFEELRAGGWLPSDVTWGCDGGWLYVRALVLTFGLARSVPVFSKITRQMCRV